MEIEHANSHPFKVEIVKDADFYANSHPYKVEIVGGGGGGGEARVVDELPEEGEPGYIYLVLKESTASGDIYDEWIWALQQDGETYDWEHLGATSEVTIKLYDEFGDNTDGAATQRLVTALKPKTLSAYLPYEDRGDYNGQLGLYGTDLWAWTGTYWQNIADPMLSINPVSDWGSFTYYTDITISYTTEDEMECTVNSVNITTFENWLSQFGEFWDLSFRYEESWDPETGEPTGEYAWRFRGAGEEISIASEDMLSTTGIDVTVEEGVDWAEFRLSQSATVNTSGPSATFTIENREQYENLSFSNSESPAHIPLSDGTELTLYPAQIKTFTFGVGDNASPDYTPYCFLAYTVNMTTFNAGATTWRMRDLGDGTLQSSGIHYLDVSTATWRRFSISGRRSNSLRIGWAAFAHTDLQYNDTFLVSDLSSIYDSAFSYTGLKIVSISYKDSLESHIMRSDVLAYTPNLANVAVTMNKGTLGAGFARNSGASVTSASQRGTFRFQVTGLGNNDILAYARGMNRVTISLYQPTSIGDNFCKGATNMTSLTITDSNGKTPEITSIGSSYLSDCTTLTTAPTSFSEVTKIGNYFMSGCRAFNSDIYLGQGLTSVGTGFMQNMSNMVGKIYLGSVPASIFGNDAFIGMTDTALSTGITIEGLYSTAFCEKFPDITNSRKLIDGGPGGGSGETYTFSDTQTGWKAEDSSGTEVFSHDDKGVSDFDQLTNVPSYNGSPMTSQTDIPEVPIALTDAQYEALWNQINMLATEINELVSGTGV